MRTISVFSTQAQAQVAEDLVCSNRGEVLPSHWSHVYENILTGEYYIWKSSIAGDMTGVTALTGYLREEEFTETMRPEGD